MKPIPVSQVTDQMLREFGLAYWKDCGSRDQDFMVEQYVDDAAKSFRWHLGKKDTYIDGQRWDILTARGIWPHVKVRYSVKDPLDGTPFQDLPFTFVVYVNAISNKEMYSEVQMAVKTLVKKLEDRFPVVAEL